MNFANLDFTSYSTCWIWFLAILLISGFSLIWSIEQTGPKESKLKKVIAVISAGLIVMVIVATIVLTVTRINIADENIKTATQNITAKYELKEVHWKAAETSAHPTDVQEEGSLLVETSNGQQYIFKYSVDEETSEPTLKNMPIQGGDSPDKSTTAEALLKK